MNIVPSAITTNPRTGWQPTIVTGATSGIGLELTRRLSAVGVTVIAIGRNRQQLDRMKAQLPSLIPICHDLADVAALDALVAKIVSRHPDLACLINNAGVQYNLRFDERQYGAEQILQELNVNLVAPVVLTRALLPHLSAQPRARIVNVGSGLGFAPKRTAAAYSASKAGLHMFSRALRVQLRDTAIQVFDVVMPLVDTPMTAGRGGAKLSAADAADDLIRQVESGRQDIRIGRARALPILQRWAPGLLARIMQRE